MLEVAGRDVLGNRQEVRHLLQLGHVHRLDGVLQQLGVAAVGVHLLDQLEDGPAGVAELHLRVGRRLAVRP